MIGKDWKTWMPLPGIQKYNIRQLKMAGEDWESGMHL